MGKPRGSQAGWGVNSGGRVSAIGGVHQGKDAEATPEERDGANPGRGKQEGQELA